jgi:hypothetical protein
METETERVKEPPWTVFSRDLLGYLLTVLSQFFSSHCSMTWLDFHNIHVVDRPDCKPEHRGTDLEKMIVWIWSAEDMKKPFERKRPRKRKRLPPRDHEQMLHRAFGDFVLDVDKHWTAWTIRISFPENDEDIIHTFCEKREPTPPPPPLPPSRPLSPGSDDLSPDEEEKEGMEEEEEEEKKEAVFF